MKEKKSLCVSIKLKNENILQLENRIESLSDDIEIKKKLISDLESTNALITKKYILSAERENNLNSQLEKVRMKLKAYTEYIKEVDSK